MSITRLLAGSLLIVLLASSCTSGSDGAVDTTQPPTTETTTETSSPASTDPSDEGDPPPSISGLDGAIGEAGDLVLSWLNGAPFDEATYEAVFDETFRSAVSFDEMTPLLDQLRLENPFEVNEIQRSTSTEAELIIVGAGGERALLAVAITSPDDPTMAGLFIGPAETPDFEVPETPALAVDRLEAMGTLRLGAFDADCAPLDAAQAVPSTAIDEQAPIGSGFKLWVLAAVVDAVDDGTLSWDDDVEIRDELDSIPSGITQNDEPGSTLTVRELAERMIEISDNTATDHLIDLVGRINVENALSTTGHSDPKLNFPLLTTREFTIVKFGDEDLRTRYLRADLGERRRILDDEVSMLDLPPIADIASVTDPIEVETLEWFASPRDLCRVLTALAGDDEAAAILARNPGVADEEGRWSSILYKGGSEPGVLAMAWLVESEGGERFVLAGGLANEDEVIDEFEAISLLAHLRDALPSAS